MFETGPMREIELRAIAAYRKSHPDGPPWLELHVDTRANWVSHVDL